MKYSTQFISLLSLMTIVGIPQQTSAELKMRQAESAYLVGNGIVEFIPSNFDKTQAPSLILKEELHHIDTIPDNWNFSPSFCHDELGNSVATITFPEGVSFYGGGEVSGSLLRNGKMIKLWNSDAPLYGIDNGTRLYQTHPWIMGVSSEGKTVGVIFDTFAKGLMETSDNSATLRSENGVPFKVYVIKRDTPQDMLEALGSLTGTISMPPRWALGYHQCRFSYFPESTVEDIADNFRARKIPCDVIWFDIDYMDNYKIFSFNDERFPDPKRMNKYLHDHNFKTVYMIDPGVAVEENYPVYQDGHDNDYFVKDAYRNEYHGRVWPESCAFPDFTRPEVREWWATLYSPFMKNGIDGIWNDMNEPSIFSGPGGTMPESNIHLGGDNLPTGNHKLYHNAYGRLMVEASYNGILAAQPQKRPFILSRSNLLGGTTLCSHMDRRQWGV